MRVLLDTRVVLWTLSGRRPLRPQAQEAIREAGDVLVSTVTFAEVGVKAAVGKLRIPEGFQEAVLASGARVLGLTAAHGLAVANLPMHHKDPFDRLLVAQAMADGLTLITTDDAIMKYDVNTVPA